MPINTPCFMMKGKQRLVDYCKNISDREEFKIIKSHANILNFAVCICNTSISNF